MEEQLISFETAKLAKEKGWDGDFVESHKILTTQSLLQKWLREIHGIEVEIRKHFACYNIIRICIYDEARDLNDDVDLNGLEFKDFKTYEEALEVGLQEALKQIPQS